MIAAARRFSPSRSNVATRASSASHLTRSARRWSKSGPPTASARSASSADVSTCASAIPHRPSTRSAKRLHARPRRPAVRVDHPGSAARAPRGPCPSSSGSQPSGPIRSSRRWSSCSAPVRPIRCRPSGLSVTSWAGWVRTSRSHLPMRSSRPVVRHTRCFWPAMCETFLRRSLRSG